MRRGAQVVKDGGEMTDLFLSVGGMTCGSCEDSIQRALSMVEGVRSVRADHRTGRVDVEADPGVGVEARREAAEDAGYDLEEAMGTGRS